MPLRLLVDSILVSTQSLEVIVVPGLITWPYGHFLMRYCQPGKLHELVGPQLGGSLDIIFDKAYFPIVIKYILFVSIKISMVKVPRSRGIWPSCFPSENEFCLDYAVITRAYWC